MTKLQLLVVVLFLGQGIAACDGGSSGGGGEDLTGGDGRKIGRAHV